MTRFLAASAALAAVLSSCRTAEEGLEEPVIVDQWKLGAEPSLVIDGDSLDLGGIGGIRRFENGSILIANNSSSQLFLFSPEGRLLRVTGRRGDGPGDFSGPITLLGMPSDTTLAVDGWGRRRWSVVTPAGRIIETKFEPEQIGWLYGTAVISKTTTAPIAGWVFTTLDNLGAKDPSSARVIEASIDDVGALWLRQANPRRWRIYHDTTGPVGEVEFPEGFDWYSAGTDYVAGVVRDSLYVPHIQIWSLDRRLQPESAESDAPEFSRVSRTSPAAHELVVNLQKVTVAQEVFFSAQGSYAATVDSLEVELAADIRLLMTRVTPAGYLAIAIDETSGVSCGLVIGGSEHPPVGWGDGEIICGLTPSGESFDPEEAADTLPPPAIASASGRGGLGALLSVDSAPPEDRASP